MGNFSPLGGLRSTNVAPEWPEFRRMCLNCNTFTAVLEGQSEVPLKPVQKQHSLF
jgi:hypothetical protein